MIWTSFPPLAGNVVGPTRESWWIHEGRMERTAFPPHHPLKRSFRARPATLWAAASTPDRSLPSAGAGLPTQGPCTVLPGLQAGSISRSPGPAPVTSIYIQGNKGTGSQVQPSTVASARDGTGPCCFLCVQRDLGHPQQFPFRRFSSLQVLVSIISATKNIFILLTQIKPKLIANQS